MSKKYTGHCACGQLTYGFDTEPTFVANCHCTDCKRASGSEIASIVLVPDTEFHRVKRKPQELLLRSEYRDMCGQGADRVFCANCGSRVVSNNLKDFPGHVFVKEGTLDRLDEWFAPKVEIFTRSREKWMPPLNLPQFDHGPS